MRTSSIINTPSKAKMTIEEFGIMIQQQNNAFVEEKLNCYNLLSFSNKEDKSFSYNDILINNEENFKSPFFNSNDSTKIESGSITKSIFSSGSSTKKVRTKLIKIDNPFKKDMFKKRLHFEDS
jgi:hypothetical protein